MAGAVAFADDGTLRAELVPVTVTPPLAVFSPAVAGIHPAHGKELESVLRWAVTPFLGASWIGRWALAVGDGTTPRTFRNPQALGLGAAVALLASDGRLPGVDLARYVFYGALDGEGILCQSRGGLPLARLAAAAGRTFVCDMHDAREVRRLLPEVRVQGLEDLAGLWPALLPDIEPSRPPSPGPVLEDREWPAEVLDVLVDAVAARSPLLLAGPQGCGKAMLAARIPAVLPPLSREDLLEIACRYSLAGHPTQGIVSPPFRAPHHGITAEAMRAEVDLARDGVLLLDEVTSFKSEAVRVALEAGERGEVFVVATTSESRPDTEYYTGVFWYFAELPRASRNPKPGTVTSAEAQARVVAKLRGGS